MAKATEYTIGVKLEGDAVDLKDAVDEAAQAMSGLSDAAGSEAAAASEALGEVPTAAGEMAKGVEDATEDAAKALEELPAAAKDAAATTTDSLDTVPDSAAAMATAVTTATDEAVSAFETVPTAAENMAADVELASVSMAESFQQVPLAATSMQTSLDATTTGIINTSGKKLKGAGKLLGGQLVQGLTGEIGSTSATTSVINTANTLFGSLLLVGGLGAVAVGVGGTLITGIIKGMQASEEALRTKVDSLLANVEDDFKGTLESILKDIESAQSLETAFKEYGGISKAEEDIAALVGKSFDRIGRLLRGSVGEGTQKLVGANLEIMADLTVDQATLLEAAVNPEVHKQLVEQNKVALAAQDILNAYEKTRGAIDKSRHEAELMFDVQHQMKDATEATSDAMERLSENSGHYASNLERADAAARNLAGRRLPSDAVLAGN